MSNIYDKSSLVLIPSGTKTGKVYSQKPVSGDGDFTFTRSSAATRINASGNIEKETQNLLLQSNTFNTTWGNSSTTETSGQSGYDGTNNAWLLTKTGANGGIRQNNTTSGVQTFSFYAKANASTWVKVNNLGSSAYSQANFDLVNGVVGTTDYIIDAKIEDVGSGWYRCITTYDTTLVNIDIRVADSDNVVSGTSGSIYIQDAQLEQGLVARDYIETTTTAVEGGITDNVPRLDYTDSSCPALLLEPQRSNILTNSEYFAAWIQFNTLNTANAITSPEGVQNANKLIAASGVNNNVIYQGLSAGTYTASIFAKKGEFEGLVMATGTTGAFFNLNTNTYRTFYSNPPTSYNIEDYGNGWYRYSITFTEGGPNNLYIGPNDNVSNTLGVTGNNSDGIYIYGAQLEAGSYPTSYIPTYGSSVTRVVDSCLKTGISSLIGQTEGTLFAQVSEFPKENNGRILGISDGTSSNYVIIIKNSTNTDFAVYATNGGTAQATYLGTGSLNDNSKIAVGYANNDYVVYVNGTQVHTDTSASVPTCSNIYVGQRENGSGTYVASGSVKQALLFKTRLSNAELATLTTI